VSGRRTALTEALRLAPPRRALGQNFTVDRGLLERVVDLAGVGPSEVVLEVGGGHGVLSERLAGRAAHLHVVEVDRRLAPYLEPALADRGNVTLHWADALKLDPAALLPLPTVLVANLPYSIAATLLVRLALEFAPLERFAAMVQREVALRLCDAPGPPHPRLYSAGSALLQLCFAVEVGLTVGRGAFRPQPHVDSSLLLGRRSAPPPSPQVVAVVRAAFAHRRKPLVHSLALALADCPPRELVIAALARLGFDPTTRAEQLPPQALARLAEELL